MAVKLAALSPARQLGASSSPRLRGRTTMTHTCAGVRVTDDAGTTVRVCRRGRRRKHKQKVQKRDAQRPDEDSKPRVHRKPASINTQSEHKRSNVCVRHSTKMVSGKMACTGRCTSVENPVTPYHTHQFCAGAAARPALRRD